MTAPGKGVPALSSNAGPGGERRRLVMLSAMFFCIFAGAGAQQAYLVQYLLRVTSWGRVRASLILSVLYCTMVMFRTLNLRLFPAWSDRAYTFVGSVTYLLFTLVLAGVFWVPSFPLALVSAVVWGIGAAMMWAGTTMQVLQLSDRLGGRYGTRMGILYSSTHAGWFSGAVLLGLIYRSLAPGTLYVLYLSAAALTFPGVVLAAVLPPTGSAVRDRPTLAGIRDILEARGIRLAGLLQFLSALGYGVVLGAFGRYVEQTCGARWVWISIALYPAARIVFSPMSGRLMDRFGGQRVLAAGFFCGAFGLGALAGEKGPAAAILAGTALGLLNSAVPVVVSAMVGEVPRRRRHLFYGVLFGMRDLGVAVAAVGVNLLGIRFQMQRAFGVFSVIFLACALLSLRLRSGFRAFAD